MTADTGRLSAHFTAREFADHVTGEVKVDPELVTRLELLRSLTGGRPLYVVSGYRSPATNRAVGGAPRSQHLLGKAADLRQGYATVEQATEAGFRGIGYVGRWAVHVDVRPGPVVRFFDG